MSGHISLCSGAPDGRARRTAKVWKDFGLKYELKGHEYSVWAVLIVDEEDQYLTGECGT